MQDRRESSVDGAINANGGAVETEGWMSRYVLLISARLVALTDALHRQVLWTPYVVSKREVQRPSLTL